MINKLYNLKKIETDQKFMEKGQIMSKIQRIESEILFTKNQIDTARIQQFGAISDFMILSMHKNNMRYKIAKLEEEKRLLNIELDNLVKQIIALQKESEQYLYILEEEKKEALKKVLLAEQEASEEYIQSKYITQ